VYNNKTQVMVSFDDAKSLSMSNRYCHLFCQAHLFAQIAAKGKFIKSTGLAGFSMFETAGDSQDILLDAINFAIGNTYY
jgi:chitinase